MNLELLEALRKNSRIKISVFARKKNKPITTIHFNYHKLMREAIKKNTSLLNFESMGLKRNIIIAECNPEELEEAAGKNINNLIRLNKGILVEIITKNDYEKENILNNLSEKRIKYSYHPVFEALKQEEIKI